jgi:hypothetical protein
MRSFISCAGLLHMMTVLLGCSSAGPTVRQDSRFLTGYPVPEGDSVYTFYALGDWGTGYGQQYAVADRLRADLDGLSASRLAPPVVVGLGDNIYEEGLKEGWGSAETDSMLESKFGRPYRDIMWQGRPVEFQVVPGNHDYGAGLTDGKRREGFGDVIHQETTAEGRYGNFNYYPLQYAGKPDSNDREEYDHIRRTACLERGLDEDCEWTSVIPLPESLTLPQEIPVEEAVPMQLIALDTQGILERQIEYGDSANARTWAVLDSLLEGNDHPWKFVLSHHPYDTYGSHGKHPTVEHWTWTGTRGKIKGGYSAARTGILGATIIGAVALGSPVLAGVAAAVALVPPASVLVDKWFVRHPQDTDHPAYKAFELRLEEILHRHDAIMLSGHDHSLQLIEVNHRTIQVISGSAGKTSAVAGAGGDLHYSAARPGFARFDLTGTDLWIRFCALEPQAAGAECGPSFHTSLESRRQP